MTLCRLQTPQILPHQVRETDILWLHLSPPSVLDSHVEEDSFFEVEVDEVWQSDDAEANWERCRVVMRRAGRDGRILELWRRWFADDPDPQDVKGKRKQWTEDDDPLPSTELPPTAVPIRHTPSPIANILPALRKHASNPLCLVLHYSCDLGRHHSALVYIP